MYRFPALLSHALPALLIGSLLSAASVEEITTKHYGAMLTDLEAYIAENPDAEDLATAYENATRAAFMTENTDKVISLLEQQFGLLKQRNPFPAQEVAQTGMMLAQFAMQNGKPEIAEAVYADFKSLSETHDDPTIQQVTNMLKGMADKPSVGTELELAGTTLAGKDISLDDYEGKVVMIDFWATWCGPCVAELPNVKAVYNKYHEKGFEIIGVSLDRSKETLEKFIAKENIGWPNLYDQDQVSSLADQFGVTSIPTVYLIDREGKIAALDPRGPRLGEEVAKLMDGK